MSLITSILAFGGLVMRARAPQTISSASTKRSDGVALTSIANPGWVDPAERSNDELDLAAIITDLKLENEQLKGRSARLEAERNEANRYVEYINRDRATLQLRIAALEGTQAEDLPGTQQVSAQLATQMNATRALLSQNPSASFGMLLQPGGLGVFPTIERGLVEDFCNCVPARHDMLMPRRVI